MENGFLGKDSQASSLVPSFQGLCRGLEGRYLFSQEPVCSRN